MAVEKLGRGRGGGRAEKRGRSTFGLAAGGGRRTRDIARGWRVIDHEHCANTLVPKSSVILIFCFIDATADSDRDAVIYAGSWAKMKKILFLGSLQFNFYSVYFYVVALRFVHLYSEWGLFLESPVVYLIF